MNLLHDKPRLILSFAVIFLLSGCNTESSHVEQSSSSGAQIPCRSEDKGSADFWDCDTNKKLEFFANVHSSNLSIMLRDGEFFLSRDLGHLEDPEFEDMLTVSDSLPYLVKIICSDSSNLEKVVLSERLEVESSKFQAELPVRRSINEDPNVYEWRVKAADVYHSLNQYCL